MNILPHWRVKLRYMSWKDKIHFQYLFIEYISANANNEMYMFYIHISLRIFSAD